MSKGTDKSKEAPAPPEEHEPDGLATSDDLFGHLVDAPSPRSPVASPAARTPYG